MPSPGTAPPRDWIQISVTALPGLAAVIALIFTALSIHATDIQLQITEQGQLTDRYNAAITNLGSPSEDVRLGGIYALQRIMQDSPRDQPTVVSVLCAYVRNHASDSSSGAQKSIPVTTDVQAALTVVGSRNPAYDRNSTVVDFHGADLTDAQLTDAHLSGADLASADLFQASLNGAELGGADLDGADLSVASLISADLHATDLASAKLSNAILVGADLHGAGLSDADLSYADLTDADLINAAQDGVNLTGANLYGAKGILPSNRR